MCASVSVEEDKSGVCVCVCLWGGGGGCVYLMILFEVFCLVSRIYNSL